MTKQTYFSANSEVILNVPRKAGVGGTLMGAHEMLVSLAHTGSICSAVSGQQPTSTHGERSIADQTGLGPRSVRSAQNHLLAAGDLCRAPAAPPGVLPDHVTTTFIVEAAKCPDLQLSSDLLQKTRSHGSALPETFAHLRHEIGTCEGIPAQAALIDALSVFIVLHREQDFADFSGVDPHLIHSACLPIAPGEDGAGTNAFRQVSGCPGWSLVTVNKPTVRVNGTNEADWKIDSAFIDRTLPDLDPKEVPADKATRFRHALTQLRRSKLTHEVLVIWDGDPLQTQTRFRPEVWSTLYVGGRRDTDHELRLIDTVHDAALATGTLERAIHMGHGSDHQIEQSGRYRFMAPTHIAKHATVVTQLRARRWGYTKRSLASLASDAARVMRWQKEIERMVNDFRVRASSRLACAA